MQVIFITTVLSTPFVLKYTFLSAVGGIGRAIYDRVFKWLIEKCNDTLIGKLPYVICVWGA